MSGDVHVPICHDCGAVTDALVRAGRRKVCSLCASGGGVRQATSPSPGQYAASLSCKGCRKPFASTDRRSNRYCARCRGRLADDLNPEVIA